MGYSKELGVEPIVSRMHPQVDTIFFPNVIFVSSFFKPLSIIWVSD